MRVQELMDRGSLFDCSELRIANIDGPNRRPKRTRADFGFPENTIEHIRRLAKFTRIRFHRTNSPREIVYPSADRSDTTKLVLHGFRVCGPTTRMPSVLRRPIWRKSVSRLVRRCVND